MKLLLPTVGLLSYVLDRCGYDVPPARDSAVRVVTALELGFGVQMVLGQRIPVALKAVRGYQFAGEGGEGRSTDGEGAKETINEEIIVSPEEIVDEVKEEVKKAPSKLRQKLRQLAAVWERASVRSSASGSEAGGSDLAGMYGAKFQALAKEHEQARPDKR